MYPLLRWRRLFQKCSFYLQYIAYEIFYYLLGGRAILEDVTSKSRNKCPIFKCSDHVALVTGGGRGIGLALVKKFLMSDMTVIVGCRNVRAGEEAMAQIRKEGITSGHPSVFELDLTSLRSVRDFAIKVREEFGHLTLLVNNAGIMFPPYQETEDGFESQWQVNYLAPFLLVHYLFPILQDVGGLHPRVINVTSCAHEVSLPIDFENISMKDGYIPSAAYAQSKLAQVLFSIELDKHLRQRLSEVRVLSVHPGIVNTELFNGTPLKVLCPWVLKFICKDVDEGAVSVLYACVSPHLDNVGGVYVSNCRIKEPGKLALDETLQKKLFEHSLKVLKIKEFGKNENN